MIPYTGSTALSQLIALIKTALAGKANASHTHLATAAVSLTVAGWAGAAAPYTQTVSVAGVTANNQILPAADGGSRAAYTASGCYCSAQAAGALTFSCTEKPSEALTVNVLILS